jgi:LysR family transcriptional regulator for bpeEF and oprC
MPRASMTVIIQRLEAHLKVRLLQRTTRRLSLTADGAAYYERCVRILAEVEEAENAFEITSQGPRGKLRIDMPVMFKTIVVPEIQAFHSRYPNIDLMLGFSDKPIDLIHEGVDCVVRIGTLQDSSLVARRIGTYRTVTVAHPNYIERYGEPRAIEDLESHIAVNYFWTRTGRVMELTFEIDGKVESVKMGGFMAVNDTDVYVETCLRGMGLIQAPLLLARPYLKKGELVEVLSQWKPAALPISAVYPANRHLSLAVRVFVDWVAEVFEKSPLL